MKKYLKRGLAVLTCTAMCIQSPLMTLAEEVQRTNGEVSAYLVDNYGVATQALEEPQWKKDSIGSVVSKCRWLLSKKPVADDQRKLVSL